MWFLTHYICSQEAEEGCSQTDYSDIELLARSKSKTIPERFCWHGSLTEAYLSSLSGTMLEPSQSTTQTHEATLNGYEEGTGNSSFVAGSPNFARTFQQPDAGKESQAHEADCGHKWRGLLAKYDPSSRSWKTAQCSLLEGLEQSLEIWPRSGLMRNGVCYQRQTLARSICGKESGFFPDGVTTFHTPTTQGMNGGSNSRRALKRRTEKDSWPTPRAGDGDRNGSKPQPHWNRSFAGNWLRDAVLMWPTPTVCGNYNRKGISKTSGDGLATAVNMWPTPQASDNRDRGDLSTPAIARRIEKGKQVMLSMCVSQESGQLNPEWVEWLMNWPIGWTSLEPMKPENFERWKSANAAYFDSNGEIETWCNNDPSESQHDKVPRVTTGVASRAERLKALGNGQFPRTAAAAWNLLLAPANTAQAATKLGAKE